MEQVKKLNIFQKIQSARVVLNRKDIKKTGLNKFSNYSYFELGDFQPYINEICEQLGLYTEFLFTNEMASLTIYDTESEDKRVWTTPIEVAMLKGCSNIQNIGGTQTFARRYLYIMAFEIAEADSINNSEIDHDAEQGKQKINQASVMTINKLIDETGTDKKKFLEWANVKKVEEITNAALGTCINMLNKKKTDKEKAKALDKEQQKLTEQLITADDDLDF